MHDDITRKIAKNKDRLALTQGGIVDESAKVRVTEKCLALEADIAEYLQEAERSGFMGKLKRNISLENNLFYL
jgi:hypothetical protein